MEKLKFKSRWGFIIACVGSAVGMANVWGFHYKVGSNGGGAFLLCYLFFIMIFSYTGLSSEYAIGRRSKTGTLGSYQYAWKTRNKEKIGKIIGWIPLIGMVTIAIGYSVIISYVFKALVDSLSGMLMTANPEEWFNSFAFKNYSVIPYHVFVVIFTMITVLFGVSSIEKTNKIIMPLFFILFLILAIRVFFMPGAIEGYKFMFTPDWTYLKNPMTWVWAMGQAFFSLSITGSGMIVYGSYLGDDVDILNGAKNTALFDTLAALVAALVMIPAAFAFKLDQSSGPGLLFNTLPKVLQNIQLGQIFSVILYTAVLFGGVSSMQNMLEAVTESITYKIKGANRKVVLVLLCIVVLSAGIFMEPIAETKGAILGGWGPWMDLVSIYVIPIGAALGAFSWFWVWKKEEIIEEINKGSSKKIGKLWYFVGKWIYTPLAIILCLIALIYKISF
ncbi:sodium-dependent transporter [Helcococcus bovis]|uniref:Sodium-dependent transporter n=2 Tax=Helcococcus bovis TaxID=3153252 RepID=A0ABW9F7L3_9FIRM